jgi:hypothetical protein
VTERYLQAKRLPEVRLLAISRHSQAPLPFALCCGIFQEAREVVGEFTARYNRELLIERRSYQTPTDVRQFLKPSVPIMVRQSLS